MTLFAAVQPLVMTRDGYQATFGEDDPEEIALMQVNDRHVAESIAEVLQELFDVTYDPGQPRDDEGPSDELGELDDLLELRRIAAAVHGKTTDDYQEGRVALGMQFNHLINHAEDAGYYLPVPFEQTFFVDEISVGSAANLLAELEALEPTLSSLFPTEVAQALATPLDELIQVAGPAGVWARLRRLCSASLELDLPLHLG